MSQLDVERVSIIVPIYNGEDGVSALLDALRAQDYPSDRFEVLIVDNGSTDNTMDIIEAYGRAHPTFPLRLLKEHERRGSYAARNKGVSVATGDILAFTDGDCQPISTWLSAGVEALRRSGVAQAAGAIEFLFANQPPNIWEYIDSIMHLRQPIYVRDNHFGATANLFVRAEALRAVGGFRDDLKSGGDFEFGQRMHDAGYQIVYAEAARILHVARASHDEVVTKIRRVASGLKTLETEGRVRPVSFRDLKPRRQLPESAVPPRGLLKRAQLFALMNYLHYVRLHARATARAA